MRSALARLRMLRNVPSRLRWRVHTKISASMDLLVAEATDAHGRTQTYARVVMRPKAGWTRSQLKAFCRKLSHEMVKGKQQLLTRLKKTDRVSSTDGLREAVAAKYGMTVQQLKALGLDMDHMRELVAGGDDLTPDLQKTARDLANQGIAMKVDLLWALDPSVNRSVGSRMGQAGLHRAIDELRSQTPNVIFLGFVPGS